MRSAEDASSVERNQPSLLGKSATRLNLRDDTDVHHI
jgi:hypothetical protein